MGNRSKEGKVVYKVRLRMNVGMKSTRASRPDEKGVERHESPRLDGGEAAAEPRL